MNSVKNTAEELEKIEIDLFLQGIYEWYGYDYRNYAYNSIRRRIWHRVYEEKLSSILELLNKVLHDSNCLHRLTADFSINVTEMFRDPKFFSQFREEVVPILRTYPSIRIWHAGCATGEEVYSMAILLHEEGLYEKTKIYATDINPEVLKLAKSGQFYLETMKKYTRNYREAGGVEAFSEYYSVNGNHVKFDPFLSRNIIFAQHNLVTDRSFNEFHVVICRNVLIYFDRSLQMKVHELFYKSLGSFGFLGLGDKEAIPLEISKSYKALNGNQKLYQKKS